MLIHEHTTRRKELFKTQTKYIQDIKNIGFIIIGLISIIIAIITFGFIQNDFGTFFLFLPIFSLLTGSCLIISIFFVTKVLLIHFKIKEAENNGTIDDEMILTFDTDSDSKCFIKK